MDTFQGIHLTISDMSDMSLANTEFAIFESEERNPGDIPGDHIFRPPGRRTRTLAFGTCTLWSRLLEIWVTNGDAW